MIEFPPQPTRVIIPSQLQPIQTKRLLLRPIELSDANSIYEFQSRKEVVEWLWSKTSPSSVHDVEAKLESKRFSTPDATGAIGRLFYFAIVCAGDPEGKVIGAVGVNSLIPAPSIGYGVHPDYWGKGYASEAVGAVVDAWGKLERKMPIFSHEESGGDEKEEKLFAACNPVNIGSVGVLTRNGFRMYREATVGEEPVAFFEREMSSG